MTEDEKYEIATLVSEMHDKLQIFQAHMIMNTPTDPVEREKAMVAFEIARTEYMEAATAVARAQTRIANKADP